MSGPGETSNSSSFGLSTGQCVLEAFDRIQIRPHQITRHHLLTARTSINLEMIRWSNVGVSLFKIVSGSIYLNANQVTYTLPRNLVTLTDVWYSLATGSGSYQTQNYLTDEYGTPVTDEFGNPIPLDGVEPVTTTVPYRSDRILTPLTRQEYAMITDKNRPGIPTQYWYQALAVPTITFWRPPYIGAPTAAIEYYGLARMQDAEIGGGGSPDVLYRGLDALCARLAWRLAQKFRTDLEDKRKKDGDEAWYDFVTRDQEAGGVSVRPDISSYARI